MISAISKLCCTLSRGQVQVSYRQSNKYAKNPSIRASGRRLNHESTSERARAGWKQQSVIYVVMKECRSAVHHMVHFHPLGVQATHAQAVSTRNLFPYHARRHVCHLLDLRQ